MKKFALKLTIFCFSIFISLIFVELLFRAYLPFSRTAQLLASDLNWKSNPSEMKSLDELRANNPSFLLPNHSLQGFTTNSQGFLSPEHTLDKPDNTYRIVFIGDSFGVGVVPYDQHFIRLLENEINETQLKKKVEIINLSMPAIGLPTYERFLALEGMKYDPDVVIISFFVGNDFTDDYNGLKQEQRPLQITYLSKIFTFFRRYKELTKIRNSQAIAQPSTHSPGTFHPNEKPSYDPTTPSYTEEQYLEMMKNKIFLFTDESSYLSLLPSVEKSFTNTTFLQTTQQIPTYILIIPDEVQVNPKLAQQVISLDQLNQLGVARNLPQEQLKTVVPNEFYILDLLPIFLNQENPSELYQPYDSHINSNGNLLVKDILFQILKDKVN